MEKLLVRVLLVLTLFLGLDCGYCDNGKGMGIFRSEKMRELDSSGALSNGGGGGAVELSALNTRIPNIRRFLQLGRAYEGGQRNDVERQPKVLASPAPAPAFMGKQHRKGHNKENILIPPSPAPISSLIHSPSTPPFLPTSRPLGFPSSAKPSAQISFPPSFNLNPPPIAASNVKHATIWPIYASVAAGVLLLAILAPFLLCCRASNVVTVSPWATGLSGQLQKAFVTGVPALKRSELETACEDFSNIIGSLSDGVLYKGTLSSGVEIAVIASRIKSAKDWSKQCESQFRKKVTSLSRVNHKNFVNLIGYCEEEEPFTRMMVFEYAPNGTLFEHLHIKETESLDWPTRLRIAMGIAYCLEHMNQLSPPFILKNLDTSTIYLTDDFAAKVSDLDFWNEEQERKATDSDDSLSSDPESVVFKYGIILLEILSGRFPVSDGSGLLVNCALPYLNQESPMKELIDPTLESFNEESVDALCEVIRSCIDSKLKKKPTMGEVASKLREITAMSPDGATPKVSPLWWAELEIISSEMN
ncbi:probable inactive receptor-like protein kinase At3g56050 [Ananas comosus]|uniref:Probable inactive receptor-like protein kinase At3g56050 n=1 Tax=Ananas comosus TaxID=4615 RepID=A0A6P5F0M4_ANACO|nr:probable inactive receptor-like protein kinase At3g56050 [Ananas comosus]